MKEKQHDQLFDVSSPLKASKLLADPIEEMVGALTDPLIVCPGGGWENDIPQRIRDELPIRRLAHLMLCLRGEATSDEVCDLEALAYLYPASMVAPMDNDWANIYMY